MQAVIETGGKQYIVKEGDELTVEKLTAEEGQEVVLDKVLAILDGKNSRFGTPTLEGATVKAQVTGQGKGKKIRVFKYKPKRNERKLNGHRQSETTLKVLAVTGGEG